MKIFLLELKKLWNLKTTAVILVFSSLYFILFLHGNLLAAKDRLLSSTDVMIHTELLERYGVSVDRDEILDFDVDRRIQAEYAKGDAIIAADETGIFVKYGIRTYKDFEEISPDKMDWDDFSMMVLERDGYFYDIGWQLSVLRNNIKDRYLEHDPHLNPHNENAFLAVREKVAREDKSVMSDYIPLLLTQYASTLNILCVICAVILTAPFVSTDRVRKIYQLQYTGAYGRKILGTQLTAVIVSVFFLSIVLTMIGGGLYATLNTQIFWDASIVSFSGMTFYMYSITYGQFVILLAIMSFALSLATACVGFLVSRYSDTYVKLITKAVPLGLVGAIIAYAAVTQALSNENPVFILFGRCLPVPEIWVCMLLLIVAIIVVMVIVKKEKRVDVI